MTTKAEFNAEEWQQVTEGPALAGFITATAQRGGTIRETVSMAKAFAEAKKEHGTNDLVGEVAASVPKIERERFTSAEQLRSSGLDQLRGVVALLEQKATPEEVDAYKRFTLAVAEAAAEADKSGGVLGIGGERVTDAEREALAAIAEALGTEPPAPATE